MNDKFCLIVLLEAKIIGLELAFKSTTVIGAVESESVKKKKSVESVNSVQYGTLLCHDSLIHTKKLIFICIVEPFAR